MRSKQKLVVKQPRFTLYVKHKEVQLKKKKKKEEKKKKFTDGEEVGWQNKSRIGTLFWTKNQRHNLSKHT